MEPILIIAIILVVLGVAGSILPALPGPVFSFVGLLLLYIGESGSLDLSALIWFGVVMVLLILTDYLAPILGAKFSGATKQGLVGAVVGSLLGILFFPPLGIFLGAFAGAYAGEMASGKRSPEALKAGIGTLLGSVVVIVLQTIYSLFVAVYFFVKLF